jgi:hypothetical protein
MCGGIGLIKRRRYLRPQYYYNWPTPIPANVPKGAQHTAQINHFGNDSSETKLDGEKDECRVEKINKVLLII